MRVTVALLLFLLGAAADAGAAELLMFRRDGCIWCGEWDRAIGPIYGKTEFAGRAPIRMLDLDRDGAHGAGTQPVRYTPTFVLMEDGREIGRIEGYPGEEFFWARLEALVRTLPR